MILDVNLKIGGCYAPRYASKYLIEGLERGDSDPKVACNKQDIVYLIKTRVVFRISFNDISHFIYLPILIL